MILSKRQDTVDDIETVIAMLEMTKDAILANKIEDADSFFKVINHSLRKVQSAVKKALN